MATVQKYRRKTGEDDNGDPIYGPVDGYQVRYRDDEGAQRARHFDRKEPADAFAVKVEHDKRSGTFIDPAAGRQMFLAYADEWAESQPNWKASTKDSWPGVRARLEARMADATLASVDRLRLQKLQKSLAETYARRTVTLTMAYAGMIMRAAYQNGKIGRDPTIGLKPPKRRADEPDDVVGPDQVPTRAEALTILQATPARFRAGTALGMAGLRIGEVLGVCDDRFALDQPRPELTIDQQMQRLSGGRRLLTTPKAEKVRTIRLPGFAVVEVRRHLRDFHASPDGLLFRGARGALMDRSGFYDSAWKPALKAAGLGDDRFVFHSLRHWCASVLLAEGASLTAVAGHLGDTVETVSRTYVHWLRDDVDVPAELLDRVLAPEQDEAVAL